MWAAGLTWRDDPTQDIIARELSRVPTVGSALRPRPEMSNRLEIDRSDTRVNV